MSRFTADRARPLTPQQRADTERAAATDYTAEQWARLSGLPVAEVRAVFGVMRGGR